MSENEIVRDALRRAVGAFNILTNPENIHKTSVAQAWAQAIEAGIACRRALDVVEGRT